MPTPRQMATPRNGLIPRAWGVTLRLGVGAVGRFRHQERQVIHMAINVAALLDKAIVTHSLSSDYKLALVMGVSHNTLSSYRHGKTLPDARVISKICALTGDDPAVLLAEIEAERAKTDEARALWREVIQRLQSTLHAAVFSVLTAGVLWGGLPSDATAKTAGFSQLNPLYIVEYLARLHRRWHRRCASAFVSLRHYIAGLFTRPCHV